MDAPPIPRQFDKAYFDTWYRHPRRRVKSPTELAREVEFVLRAAEHLLGRTIRSVLDVGCGEGQWWPALRRRRPTIRYTGVDPSEYAVERWGRRRNIRLGGITDLGDLGLDSGDAGFDLVICCGVLNYLTAAELTTGLAQIATQLGGVAYLELYTDGDAVTGDTRGAPRRPATWYRRALRRAGFTPCGMQLYVGEATARRLAALARQR